MWEQEIGHSNQVWFHGTSWKAEEAQWLKWIACVPCCFRFYLHSFMDTNRLVSLWSHRICGPRSVVSGTYVDEDGVGAIRLVAEYMKLRK